MKKGCRSGSSDSPGAGLVKSEDGPACADVDSALSLSSLIPIRIMLLSDRIPIDKFRVSGLRKKKTSTSSRNLGWRTPGHVVVQAG
jgi:hypothetical protein